MEQEIKMLQTLMIAHFFITIAIQMGILLLIGSMVKQRFTEPKPSPTATPSPYSPTFTMARTGRLPYKDLHTEEAWEKLMGRFEEPKEGWKQQVGVNMDPIKGSQSGELKRMDTTMEWKPIASVKVPTHIPVDVKTAKGTIYTRCFLNSTNPEEWDPEFIKYKGIKYWRYSPL